MLAQVQVYLVSTVSDGTAFFYLSVTARRFGGSQLRPSSPSDLSRNFDPFPHLTKQTSFVGCLVSTLMGEVFSAIHVEKCKIQFSLNYP